MPVLKMCNTCKRSFSSPDDFLSHTSRWRICDQQHLWFNCSCLSTGIILKGKHDWYNPADHLSEAAQSVFNRISRETQLPRLPHYVMELQQLLEDPEASTDRMAKIIKHDALLASAVLRVANNQKIQGSPLIQSLSHAIAFIGVKSLRDLLTLAAVSRFELKTSVFSAADFWTKSFLTGRIAEYLVEHLKLNVVSDQAFLAASTCNIGKIVQGLIDPATADRYASELEDLNILGTWSDAEKRHQGYDHQVLGEIGAAFWGFPDELLDGIAKHHSDPLEDSSPPEPITLWEIAGLANQLCHWISLDANQMNQKLLKKLRQRLQISEKRLETLVDGFQQLQRSVS